MRSILRAWGRALSGSCVQLLALLFLLTPAVVMGQARVSKSDGGPFQNDNVKDNSKHTQQAGVSKPELVLQTGYNSSFGAARLVFSPDDRLLATTTLRS
ncbi:MAG: hypothetical protein ACRD8U_19035, partial [Pyrinomonadaceae bacterium]